MNSIKRIKAAVNFEVSDRVPVIAQVFGHAATLAGVDLKDYVQNGDLLARCQIQALKRYDYDAVFALMDVGVETEAVGSKLNYRANLYPAIGSYALSSATDIASLSIPNPHEAGRMPELLKAVKSLRQAVGDDVLVVGCVSGPMTLATQLLGIEKTLYLAIDEPEQFYGLMKFATKVAIDFGIAQIEAGAHLPIVFDPSSSPDVIPPQFYREFVLPHMKALFTAYKQAGTIANWLHTAGPIAAILPLFPTVGVDIANLDYCVDPSDALERVPNTCLDGNIKPLSFVQETPETITAESSELLDRFSHRGGFILSSGCEIPPESKPENIAAMVSAVRKKG